MTTAQPFTQSPPSEPSDAERAARQLRQLAELSELAMNHARATQRAAETEPTPANKAAFATAARIVTQIIALENWIARNRAQKAAAEAKATLVTTTRQRATQAASLRHQAEQTIAVAPGLSSLQRYRCRQYLTGLDLGAELSRPLPELIASICRALAIPVPDAFAEPAALPATQPAIIPHQSPLPEPGPPLTAACHPIEPRPDADPP